MGRDKDHKIARSLETAGCVRREFIMGLHVGIVEIAVELELIVPDLFVVRNIPATTLLLRIGTRSCVEVKARQQATHHSDSGRVVDVSACRGKTVRASRRSGKLR